MDYNHCANCGEEIASDSDFCPHCGVLFDRGEPVVCDTDASEDATAVCIICRKLVCDKCGVKKSGRFLCQEHKGVKVEQDWVLIFQSPEINESGLVESFLKSQGFNVVVRNFTPQGFIWDGGGDSLFSRQAINRPAKVFVPIPEYLKATEALKEWESGRVENEA